MAKKTVILDAEQTNKPAELATVSAEPAIETPEAKKPKAVKRVRKVKKPEVVAETPPKKPASKPAKPKAKRAAKPGPKKVLEAKAKKPTGRKPGLKKKVAEKPKKAVAAKAKKAPGSKAGRKLRKKTGPKGAGLAGRKADLLKMGESAILYSLDLQRQIEEMERAIANYERLFEAVRGLFSREMDEIEELVAGLLE